MWISPEELHTHVGFDGPNWCPVCGGDLVPKVLSVNQIKGSPFDGNYAVTLLCPLCQSPVFLNVYCYPTKKLGRVVECYPPDTISDLPKSIKTGFPEFYNLYLQAALAEAKGCVDICGAGFRRALESLVKNYATQLFPESADTINKEKLMQTINRIDGPKIQTLAKASTWLGNDQTHLQVKHPDYGIDDMKAFIKALCYFILMENEFKRSQALTNPAPHQ